MGKSSSKFGTDRCYRLAPSLPSRVLRVHCFKVHVRSFQLCLGITVAWLRVTCHDLPPRSLRRVGHCKVVYSWGLPQWAASEHSACKATDQRIAQAARRADFRVQEADQSVANMHAS